MELPALKINRREHQRLPFWLKKPLRFGEPVLQMASDLKEQRLHTVCEEARCPNRTECWSRGTATIMVLGDTCTRHCGFCSVTAGKPAPVDLEEPQHTARMVQKLGLKHVVITMVARDDLEDGGATHVARVIEAVRKVNPQTKIEILTSDFEGKIESIQTVIEAGPDVFNHNLETVERLTPQVRHRATYRRSLDFLKTVKENVPDMVTKSGVMLGLGEEKAELFQALKDLREVGCELLTLGQYLRPTMKNLPVVEFVKPEVFEEWKIVAEQLGFRNVASGPFVRSSYHAEEMIG